MKAAVLAVALAASITGMGATRTTPRGISANDWPTYGHDAQRTFHGHTKLTRTSVTKLARAWFFPTGLSVTATPTVVRGTVYVGSWDGHFYALDLRTGALRWSFLLDAQPAVSPSPQGPPDSGSSGGIVTSSAWFEPRAGKRPDLVLFGGGFTLYALNARTGALYWKHAYTGRPDAAPDPAHDGARIFSSPVVADGNVIVGVAVEGERGSRGRVVAADLDTGEMRWQFVTDVDSSGHVLDDGCGSVWSSGSLMPKNHLVLFDTSDCHFSNPEPYDETVFALRTTDGTPQWVFHAPRVDDKCDFDFGASVNVGLGRHGDAQFAGVGGKDGTYYRLNPANGDMSWARNVVFGGFAGGFIGTTAFDGRRVYGSTALGDFGRFESNGPQVCDSANPRDTAFQEPSAHAIDATSSKIAWEASGAASFGPTTVARGMTFNCPALRSAVDVRDASNGRVIKSVVLPVPCWSGIATVGNALVFGTGASFNDAGSGVMVLTPGGATPS